MSAAGRQVQGRKGKIRARSRKRSRRSVAEQHRGAIFINEVLLICIFSIAVHPEVRRPQRLLGGRPPSGKLLKHSAPSSPAPQEKRGKGESQLLLQRGCPLPSASPWASGSGSPAPRGREVGPGLGKGLRLVRHIPRSQRRRRVHTSEEEGIRRCCRREIGQACPMPRPRLESLTARKEGKQEGRQGGREAGKERVGLQGSSCTCHGIILQLPCEMDTQRVPICIK